MRGAPANSRPWRLSWVTLRTGTWAGYAACAWALLFAALSFYWAAGGTVGTDTLGGEIERLGRARDPGFVALLWATGALKALGGLLALALSRPWGGRIPRWMPLTAAWAAGAGMAAYGAIQLVVTGGAAALMASGLLRLGPVDWTAIRWHLLLWDPWWLLGGLLFCAAAWSFQRGSRPASLKARATEVAPEAGD